MEKNIEMMKQIYSALVLLNSITASAARVASIMQNLNAELAMMDDKHGSSTPTV